MSNMTIDKKKITLLLSVAFLSSTALANEADKDKTDEPEVIVVTAPSQRINKDAGSTSTITSEEMQREGGNNFGSIMRYQPLISAPSTMSGSGTGKSSWDRAGYSGYNIRGLDANRVSIDVDGIEQPIAQGRVNSVGRNGLGTYGMGRDYIDPYMYGVVNIESGATSVGNRNNALGGSVSFVSKTARDYLLGEDHYFGYQSNYDSSNRSLQNAITMAAGDDYLSGILVLSRRDGQETRNNSHLIDAYPENWHSNSVLAGVSWQASSAHLLDLTVDYYQKFSHSRYDSWNESGTGISTYNDHQNSTSKRLGVILKDTWLPANVSWIDKVTTQFSYQRTRAHDDTDISSNSYDIQTHYNTDSYSFETKLFKTQNSHAVSAGLNARWVKDESPFSSTAKPSIGIFPDGDYSKPQADSRSYTIGGFVEDKINLTNNVEHNIYITPGIRALYQNTKPRHLDNMSSSAISGSALGIEYNSNSDFQALPALSLMYDINPNFIGYVQYKRGAQMPNANQLYGSYLAHYNFYALVGNSDLKTETSDNFEIGLKGQPVTGVTLSTAAFYNQYKNFIAYTRYVRQFANANNKIIYQADNRDKARIYGLEITSKFDMGTWVDQLDGLSTSFAFGYSKGESKSSYLGDKYIDLDSVAPLKFIMGVSWDDPNGVYGMSVLSTLQKGKRAKSTNRQEYSNNGTAISDSNTEYYRIAGHGIIDVTGYWNINKNIHLSGGIYNITDKKYWDYLSNNRLYASSSQQYLELSTAPGRSFQLGLSIDF